MKRENAPGQINQLKMDEKTTKQNRLANERNHSIIPQDSACVGERWFVLVYWCVCERGSERERERERSQGVESARGLLAASQPDSEPHHK